VPVSDDALIYLVDYGFYFTKDDEYGCTITAQQFKDFLLGKNSKDNLDSLENLWFKYSNNEITAVAEQYLP
jgi:hypothetical protein